MDYLEEQNHVGVEHYASSGITLNFNDQNELSFSTKKNFKTESIYWNIAERTGAGASIAITSE